MMNLTADQMDARLKWCQSNKNQNWDLIIFSDEILISDLRKIKKKWVQKGTVYRAPKTGKGNHKVNAWAAILRTETKQFELFTYFMDINVYLYSIQYEKEILLRRREKNLSWIGLINNYYINFRIQARPNSGMNSFFLSYNSF